MLILSLLLLVDTCKIRTACTFVKCEVRNERFVYKWRMRRNSTKRTGTVRPTWQVMVPITAIDERTTTETPMALPLPLDILCRLTNGSGGGGRRQQNLK
ncbi:unnamed protein product [Macrosiphum euphorbiae]|uniref:Secreted protein n=1 Tax=Macrosiphum euphorbiae TaxID=13131 RepID=A0AAV0WT31_9HEMI|nr:unnamed protein product [Macrosiphum euphorbiae]